MRALTDARELVPVPVARPNWRGQDVVIAEPGEGARVRRAGASYRRIARELKVSTETDGSDVQAELRLILDLRVRRSNAVASAKASRRPGGRRTESVCLTAELAGRLPLHGRAARCRDQQSAGERLRSL